MPFVAGSEPQKDFSLKRVSSLFVFKINASNRLFVYVNKKLELSRMLFFQTIKHKNVINMNFILSLNANLFAVYSSFLFLLNKTISKLFFLSQSFFHYC